MFAFLLPLLSNITIPQIVAAIPQLIKIGQAGFSIYENLTSAQNLSHEAATAQAAGLVMKAVVKLVADTVGAVLPQEHEMTQDEENTWRQHFGAGSQS